MSFPAVQPGTIVVGVDGSTSSALALAWATEQASLEGRTLTVVNAVGRPGLDDQHLLETVQTEGQEVLDVARSTVAAAYPLVVTDTLLSLLEPRETLLALAEQAAMVVVGSRGRGPVASFLLGSVSAGVARHARCPVVVLRPRTWAATRGILVGVERHGRSRAALEFAYRQASYRSLPLTVTLCSFDATAAPDSPVELAADTPGHEEDRLVLDESVSGMGEKFPDVDVRLTLGRGLADAHLVEVAGRMEMVVVGAHRDSVPFGAVIDRNVDRSVLTDAPTTVAVVPEPRHARPTRRQPDLT